MIDIPIVNIFLNLILLFRREVISRHKSHNSSNCLKGKMWKTMMKNNHLDRSRNDNSEDVEELLPNFPKFQEVFLGEMVILENHIIPRIVETSGQHMWLEGEINNSHFIKKIKLTKDACVHTQSCLTLWNPLDCSPSGFSVHGIFQARKLKWVVISSFRGIFLTQGSNPCLLCLLHCRQRFYHWIIGEAQLKMTL